MAIAGETVWAIDIGSCSLKALHVSTERGFAEVIGFDSIRHGKILSAEGMTAAEREELIALSLRKFVNRHDVSMDEIVVSVPGQNSFARFVNLPPVEQKRIGEIVKFEAVQQIPFDINDVQWDWQLMSEPDSAELKVGLFAIKNEIVNAELEHFNREDMQVSYVQMAPMALYNYAAYDRTDLVGSDDRATVVLNIGASVTDLVVCTKSGVWQRGIMIGGNTFTKAIAETFRLDFAKAEKLKRTAPMSKYARQLFQAMRPVYTDLASEIQQSLGFYGSSNPNTKVVKVIALGGGTKLRGLLKYLQQTLQIPVERPDAFKKLAIGPGISAAKFHENVCNFGVVYGLALQGLGLSNIESNLLPSSIARSMEWAGKGRYFIAAACMLLVVSLLCLGRTVFDGMGHSRERSTRQRTQDVINLVEDTRSEVSNIDQQVADSELIVDSAFDIFKHREIVPELHELIFAALPNEKNNPSQASLYRAFASGDVDEVMKTPRKQRRQIFITNMAVYYATDLANAKFGGAAMWRSTRGRPTGGTGEGDDISMEEYELMMEAMSGGGEYEFSPFGPTSETSEEKKTGFIVSVVGYSPFAEDHLQFRMLIDPPGVDDQPSKWGVATRLMNLDDFVADGNSPFRLYKKGDPEHFLLESGEVALTEAMPEGIGILEPKITDAAPMANSGLGFTRTNEDWLIVDPMTREIIGKVPVLNESGTQEVYRGSPLFEINDHWFVLNMKFEWATEGLAEETDVSQQSFAGPSPSQPGSFNSSPGSSTSGQTPRGREISAPGFE